MHFRHRNRSQDLTGLQNSDLLGPRPLPVKNALPIQSKTLEEFLARSKELSAAPAQRTVHHAAMPSNYPADYFNRNLPKRAPTSRKTGFATIRTDSTDSQAAFESDAFAVLMPTTRVPILDKPVESKNDSPAARAEAYRTYQEKARQGRERNNSQGVQIPRKLVTYGYTPPKATQCAPTKVEPNPPSSPTKPAGSFPITPPLLQNAWASPARVQVPRSSQQSVRSNICTPRKPIATRAPPASPVASQATYYNTYRPDSEAGASRSSDSPTPTTIKARLRPKVVIPPTPVQMESRRDLYNRTMTPSPASPTKSMPNFTRHNSVEGDSIFGYKSKETAAGTVAGASNTETPKNNSPKKDSLKKETPKKDSPKKKDTPARTSPSKWPWHRSKQSTTTTTTSAAVPNLPAPISRPTPPPPVASTTAYIDPFTSLATPTSSTPISLRTPTSSRSPSPKKIHRPNAAAPPMPGTDAPAGKFDTGFAQIKRFTYFVFKISMIVYAVIAMWFVLDAVRQAFVTLCAPFRAIRWVGGWVGVVLLWVLRVGGAMWERWVGVKVAVKGGWGLKV